MNVLQSMIVQITVPPPNTGSERHQERAERELIAMLDRNVTIKDLIAVIGLQRKTVTDDMAILESNGYVASWIAGRLKWFGLTKSGVARAKILREMQ